MTDFATRRRMMVDTQVRPSDVTEFPIIEAMLTVKREVFVPVEKIEAAYASTHVELWPGRFMLDARLFAKMLEALDLTNQDFVLDIGAGYGYSSAVIARIAEAVVAVEDDQTQVDEAQTLLSDENADNVILHTGALTDGAGEHGPYDAIIIEGGVETVPQKITDQLKEGGRIVCIFVEKMLGTVKVGHKLDGELMWRPVFNGNAAVLQGFEKASEFEL